MKVLVCAGDSAQQRDDAARLARGLAAAGVAAPVLAAARGDGESRIERDGGTVRLVRTDAAPDHWQRSRSTSAAALVRALLHEEAPDLVHVLGWRGLTRDLVALADAAGIRTVVTLSDAWFGCLVGDRVRRDAAEDPCTRTLGPSPCLGCAEAHAGRTPWVPIEARYLAVAERLRDTSNELALARHVIVSYPRCAHEAPELFVQRALAVQLPCAKFSLIADAGDIAAHVAVYESALRTEAPSASGRTPAWWEERMQVEAERAWDEAFLRAAEGRA